MSDQDPLINVQAEAVLLGGMMLDNRLIGQFADRLKFDDFAEPLHQRLFSAMMRFAAKGTIANAVSLRPVFAFDPDADGGGYLDQLVDSPAAIIGVPDHVEQVIDLAVRRKARAALLAGIGDIQDVDRAVGDVVGSVEEGVWAAQRDDVDSLLLSQEDLINRVLDRQERIETGEQPVGAENLLVPDMDSALGPLETNQYIILAGRPGMGKTTLAMSAAKGYALNGFHGQYFDTEMDEDQHAMRSASDMSKFLGRPIAHSVIRSGKMDVGDKHFLKHVTERAKLIPLSYKYVGECNWRRIYSLVAKEKARLAALGKKLWFIVIDYLGKLQADDAQGRPIEDDRKRVNAVSKGLKRIAKELDVAVIALAQLSRDVDKRPDKRPHNADLKESGNLEQDADAILFTYREEYYLEQEKPTGSSFDDKFRKQLEEWEVAWQSSRDLMDLIIGKNRHGKRTTRRLKFDAKHFAVRGSDYREEMEQYDAFNN